MKLPKVSRRIIRKGKKPYQPPLPGSIAFQEKEAADKAAYEAAAAVQRAAAGDSSIHDSSLGGGPPPDGEAAFLEDWGNAVETGGGVAADLGAGAQRTPSSVRFASDEMASEPDGAAEADGMRSKRPSTTSFVRFSSHEDVVEYEADDATNALASTSRVRFESDSTPARPKSVGFADAPEYVDDDGDDAVDGDDDGDDDDAGNDAAASASPDPHGSPSLAQRRARFGPANDGNGKDSRAFRTGMSVYKQVANPDLALRLDSPTTPDKSPKNSKNPKNPKSPGILRSPTATPGPGGTPPSGEFFRDTGSPTTPDGRSLSGSGRFGMRRGRSSILSGTKTFFGPKYNNLTAALREEELLKFQKLEMAEKDKREKFDYKLRQAMKKVDVLDLQTQRHERDHLTKMKSMELDRRVKWDRAWETRELNVLISRPDASNDLLTYLSDRADQDRRYVQVRRERRDSTAHELKNKVTSVAAMFNVAHGSPVRRPSFRGQRVGEEDDDRIKDDDDDSDSEDSGVAPAPPPRSRVGFAGVPDSAGNAARLSRRPNFDTPDGGDGDSDSDSDSSGDDNTRFGFASDSEGSERD